MFEAVASPYLVPFEGGFRVALAPTGPPRGAPGKKGNRERLAAAIDELRGLQRRLHAQDRWAVLVIFQALDAAGKDGTIRDVLSGVDPAGCQVFSFKRPSAEELDHDFLWRTSRCLPERGRIGIFNRSHYEEVLVVRVHPELLEAQRLPEPIDRAALWESRFRSIVEHERHLAANGTAIVKFWLHVSADEQRRRFLKRLEDEDRRWKFAPGDVEELAHREAYLEAFEETLAATSRPWAPWYAVPADDKPFLRATVAELLVATLRGLELEFPPGAKLTAKQRAALRRRLAPARKRG